MRSLAALACGLAFAAPAGAGVSAFAIATHSPGHVEFTMLSDSNNAPPNLSVENNCYDDNSQLVSSASAPVDDWASHSEGWVGRVAFDGPSGLRCFAAVHKGGSPQHLGTFSYISP